MPEKALHNKIIPSGKSFWQGELWSSILTKTKQAEVITMNHDGVQILIERRTIWEQYTALYILGVAEVFVTESMIAAIRDQITAENDLFLQIEPIPSAYARSKPAGMTKKAPFRRFIEPVTALLNLTLPETELMASFAEKGRYNIRLAQKRGVTTRWVVGNTKCKVQSVEGPIEKTYLEVFYDLLDETTTRDGFTHNSLPYYQHFVETLEENNAGGLLIAEKDGILHAAGIFAYWGDTAIYYYGASSSDTTIRRDMATYLLQWEAIREGMKRKCITYDFLGVSADGKGKLAGVTEFKLRFHPEKQYLPQEQIIIYKPVMLFLLRCVSRIRKFFR